jgi:hypothetical protein
MNGFRTGFLSSRKSVSQLRHGTIPTSKPTASSLPLKICAAVERLPEALEGVVFIRVKS